MGASAGGLEAFTRFFTAMPSSSGMAFVLIQHLDPTHESLTAELLAKHTMMPVRQVAGETPVEADHVYVIPPNNDLSIQQGILRLTPAAERRGMRTPIDTFFRSLATDRQERAIGIILSGTGSDGTLGLKEIKTVGGLAIAQDPGTAQHDGMPRSAIAHGAVDRVLAVERIPETLLHYARHPYVAVARPEPDTEQAAGDLAPVLALVRARLRFDFSGYKESTLVRRVRRRMGLRHVERLPEYLKLLQSESRELQALFRDLLIGVTRFFRDPPAWQALERQALPSLLRARQTSAPLRAWVAGCGAGEEAYTLGMVLIEQCQAAERSGPIQIFASDVDREALEIARQGVFPESIAADVPADRLRRFFHKDGSRYRVSKALRDTVIFAEQNLLSDPPFSNLDLISCRNLLIYLNPTVQQRILSLFHFALAESGVLFLGSAETIGSAEDRFETVSKRWRIYRRIGARRHDALAMRVVASHRATRERRTEPTAPPKVDHLAARVQHLLLERYAPASVVISRRYEILLFSGPVDRYLVQPPGPPTQDLLARMREGLQTPLRALVRQAIADHQPQTATGVRLRRNGASHRVRVAVEPLAASPETEGLLLVSFSDEAAAPEPAPDAAHAARSEREELLVRQLEAELKLSREELQGTVERSEASDEELRAANEEVMSINEELQSTNEELETSKEELQAVNEELNTVNAQLQDKVNELERANNDLDNLLTSTSIATVFLDRELRVRRFTPLATRLFKLNPSDLGRPLADITQTFTDAALFSDAASVLKRRAPRQVEVTAWDGRLYFRQILPYRTQDGRIDGVVITFSDVATETLQTARSELETALKALGIKEVRLRAVIDTAAEAIITVDESGKVLSFNAAAERMFGYAAAEVTGRNVRVLLPPLYRRAHDRYLARYRGTRAPRIISVTREAEGLRKDGTRFPIELAVSEFTDAAGRKFTGIVRNLTERRQAEQRLREHEASLRHVLRVRTAGELAASLAHQLNQPLSALANDVAACDAQLAVGQTTEVRKLLKHAAVEAQRAAAILRRLRDLVRRSPSRFERIDLRDVIRDAAELMGPGMARREVAFQVQLPPERLMVRADRMQIEQVVLNLVQNGLEAVQMGGRRHRRVRVRAVRVHVARGAGGLAQVTVEDSGPGIPSEVAKRLFEPFFTTKKGGLGMGLAIARTIVETHHGRIWAEPRARQGAVVRFTLPLDERPKASRAP
jgi:two-component system CheB/CheR fusion protein